MFRLLATLLCAAGVLETGSAYIYEEELLYDHFPEDFLWGAATAAYQVRGGFTKCLKKSAM